MAGMSASQIARELRAVPEEVRRASRTAGQRAGRKARAAVNRRLKGKLSNPKVRVAGRRDLLWVGANPVIADHIPGAVSVEGRRVSVLGSVRSDAFRLNPQTRSTAGEWEGEDYITMKRTRGRGMERYLVNYDSEIGGAFDAVADEAADLFLEEFDKELRKITGAS